MANQNQDDVFSHLVQADTDFDTDAVAVPHPRPRNPILIRAGVIVGIVGLVAAVITASHWNSHDGISVTSVEGEQLFMAKAQPREMAKKDADKKKDDKKKGEEKNKKKEAGDKCIPDVTYTYGDISTHLGVKGSEACSSLCKGVKDCGVFVYSVKSKDCWLKCSVNVDCATSVNGKTQALPAAAHNPDMITWPKYCPEVAKKTDDKDKKDTKKDGGNDKDKKDAKKDGGNDKGKKDAKKDGGNDKDKKGANKGGGKDKEKKEKSQ